MGKSKQSRRQESAASKPAKRSTRRAAKKQPAATSCSDRILDCEPSRFPEDDWQLTHLEEAGHVLPDAADLPASIDLRESWWKISDQLDTGSCVGWALADSVLRWHFVRADILKKNEILSPRFLWMAAKETDEFRDHPQSFIESAGTSLKAALKVADRFGCVLDSMLPFSSHRLYPGSTNSFYSSARDFRIRRYTRLLTQREWKRWLAKDGGPILIRVEVDSTWHSASGGHLEHYAEYPPGSNVGGGHAAAIVGYTDSGDFIIRNSWGTAWGNKGFGFGTPLYMDKAVTEAFGVDV